MNEYQRRLLFHWFQRSYAAQSAHYRASHRFGVIGYWLGIPSIILTTIVSSSIFAAWQDESGYYKIIFGSLSLLATSLAACQTFLRLGERSEAHRIAGVRYSALMREIEQEIVFPSKPVLDTVNRIRTEWEELNADCPVIPVRTFASATRMAERMITSDEYGMRLSSKAHGPRQSASASADS